MTVLTWRSGKAPTLTRSIVASLGDPNLMSCSKSRDL